MREERKYLEDLFQKYQRGQVTESEKEIIARLLVHLDVTKEKLTEEELKSRQQLSQKALKHLFFATVADPTVIRFPFWIRTVAASLLVMLTAVIASYLAGKYRHQATHGPVYQENVTKTGEMKIITLTDGTRVTINSKSKIKYPDFFQGKIREVFLTGEAFFEVAHDTSKPFKVHTDKVDVLVLGTTFNVKAYPEDKRLFVSVTSGKVGVLPALKGGMTYFLLPGEQLAYNRATGKFSDSKIDTENIAAWQKGILTFDNETLAGITHQLERFYKVTFRFKNNTFLTKELSLKIKNQNLQVVMKALSISGGFNYKIADDQVTIW